MFNFLKIIIMNEEMRYFAEELEEMLRKGHKMLNRVRQSMGQRGGVSRPRQSYDNDYQNWNGGNDMGERGWFGMGGYDPRIM